jgi:predicted dehydrogenase
LLPPVRRAFKARSSGSGGWVLPTSSCFGRAIEKSLGVDCYSSLNELLQANSPDFLIVATPTDSHYSLAKLALQKGIHTFIEKPLSMSAAESAELVQLAAKHHVVAQVGYVNRFNEIFSAVRALLQSGEIGAPTHVSCEIRSPMVVKSTAESWRSRQSEGGGCLCDIATHGIDLLNFLVGPPTGVIGSSLQSLVSEKVEDRVDVLLTYGGFTGALHVNWSDPSCRKPAYRLDIETQRGRIVADQHAYKVFKTSDAAHGKAGEWTTVYITDIAEPVRMYVRGNEFTRQLDYFIESIVLRRTESISDAASAAEVDKVIEQIRSAGQRVRMQ